MNIHLAQSQSVLFLFNVSFLWHTHTALSPGNSTYRQDYYYNSLIPFAERKSSKKRAARRYNFMPFLPTTATTTMICVENEVRRYFWLDRTLSTVVQFELQHRRARK